MAAHYFPGPTISKRYTTLRDATFTAAGNNFELAIAVSIGTFGATSAQALAGTIGPLIEIPVLVGLVYVMLWMGPKLFAGDPTLPAQPGSPTRSG